MEPNPDAATNGHPQTSGEGAAAAAAAPEQAQAPAGEGRHTGVVKWFNATKGFGFITPSTPLSSQEGGNGEDLFVHQVPSGGVGDAVGLHASGSVRAWHVA